MKLFGHKEGKDWEFTELIAAVSAAENQDKWNSLKKTG